MNRVKICGLFREEDILAVNQSKPDYIGFVFAKSSRRRVTVDQARELSALLSPAIDSVGVFVNQPREWIASLLQEGLIDIAQLHGQETEEDILFLQRETGKRIIKAVAVSSEEDIWRWQSSSADFLLFDHGAGGTGCRFNWDLIKACKRPFFLAGGINLENIREALVRNAYAIDLSGGVETAGCKDPEKIKNIVDMVRNFGDE